jgi:MFS family permease
MDYKSGFAPARKPLANGTSRLMASLRQSIAPVAALLLSVAILLMGSGLQGTLLPVRANLDAFTDIDIGILGSFYYVGFTAGCLAGPYLISRVGHIRTYLALVSVASAVALVHAMVVTPSIWWVLRAVTGFCFSVLYIIIESWLNERADNSNRGTIFSVYTIINLTVITVGQLMLNLADPRAFPLFAMISILISLASVPVAMTRAQSPEPVPLVQLDLRSLMRLSPVGFIGCFAHGLSSGAFWSLGPVFAIQGRLDTLSVSLFMSATVLGGAFGQYPLGRLSDRIDRRIVIVAICLSAAAAGLGMTFLNDRSLWQLCAYGFCFGIFAFPLYAVSVAHANDLAKPSAFVETSSGLMLVFGIGCALGPVMAATIEALTTVKALFLFTAAVHVLLALFTLRRITYRAPVAPEEKVDFNDALVAARTVAPIELHDMSETGVEEEMKQGR